MAILSGILIPQIFNYISDAKLSSDQATVKILNNVTTLYRVKQTSLDPFQDEDNSDEALLNVLLNNGFLLNMVEPQSEDASFSWVFEYERWLLILPNDTYVLTSDDGLSAILNGSLGLLGAWNGSETYIGDSTDIVIPRTLNGVIITNIGQNAFNSVGLTSVSFPSDSGVVRIHARAFNNNNLTEIVLPNTIVRVDVRAFYGNDLNQITLGSSVSIIEDRAFGDSTVNFKAAYASGGAGTYVLVGENWVKQ